MQKKRKEKHVQLLARFRVSLPSPNTLCQDEGWGRPTCSDQPSNEVNKLDMLWFRMQSLGEKLKEANEHKESLHPWHR